MLASLFTLSTWSCLHFFSFGTKCDFATFLLSVKTKTLFFLAESWVGNINIKGEIVSPCGDTLNFVMIILPMFLLALRVILVGLQIPVCWIKDLIYFM